MLVEEVLSINGLIQKKAIEHSTIIEEGTCITIERGQPHQLVVLEDNSEIFEVSTQHFDSDSYRIRKGDSQ